MKVAIFVVLLSYCVGLPHGGLDNNIDNNAVQEDLSCEGVDNDTCVERAARNIAKAQAVSDKNDQMKTVIVDEWYRVPGNINDWKRIITSMGLFAAHIRSDRGAPINGSQDPKSPLKLQKLFDMLGRDDCCDISDDMLEQLYDRKDVVRYIIDILYDDNPNFLVEMKKKEDERIRKGNEEEKSFAAEIVDIYLDGSKPDEKGKDNSLVYATFLQCLWALADDPGSSLRISDVWHMLDKDGVTSDNFVDVMKYERRDIVEYMVSTLMKDFGEIGFSDEILELMKNKSKLPPITLIRDISGDTQVLVDQLLDIKKKNFELFRFATMNVLLQQAPDKTFGVVAYALSCRRLRKDECLEKLATRQDVMHMIFFDLIKRHDDGTEPITTKERLKEQLNAVLYGSTVVTFDPRVILQNVTYFLYVILAAVVVLLYKFWQNKVREAEAARKQKMEKKSKKKKRQ